MKTVIGASFAEGCGVRWAFEPDRDPVRAGFPIGRASDLNLGGIALGRDCRSVARDVANGQREPTFVQPTWKVTGRVPG